VEAASSRGEGDQCPVRAFPAFRRIREIVDHPAAKLDLLDHDYAKCTYGFV
jgi:hypothetical protein